MCRVPILFLVANARTVVVSLYFGRVAHRTNSKNTQHPQSVSINLLVAEKQPNKRVAQRLKHLAERQRKYAKKAKKAKHDSGGSPRINDEYAAG